nr:unnamed protein product [Spirometra erinaceieuropaei]
MPEQADAMSKLWLAAFKSASEPAAQLALLYVVNEIILKCSSYGAPEVKTHFQEPLLEAIRYLRPGLLIKKVKKLVTMWADQKVYEPKLMHQLLRSILNLDQKTGALKENSAEQEDAVSIKDFVPEKFLEQLRKLKQVEEVSPSVTESDLTPACLKLPIDIVLGRVKSKEEGRSLSCQISTCSDRLASVLKGLEKKLAAQEEVFDILGKAELFYSIQQKEAAIVANAYRTYGQRVQSTMDALEGTNRPSEAVINDSTKLNSSTILESNQPDTTSATAASPPTFDTAVDDDDDDDDYDDYNEVGDNSAMAVSRTGFIDTDGEDEEDETDERDEFSELKTEPKSVPFGLTNQRRRTRLKSADSEVNDDNNNIRQPFDFVAVATFPFRELIRVDSNGDADYRPMFEKMRERQSQPAGNLKRSHEEMAYNAAFDLPGSGDFDGRLVEVKPSRPVDVPDRNGLTGSSPQPPVVEDNMDVSDDEAKEEPTLDDAPPPPPSEAVKVQPALTDTGDYDWRQTKPTLPKMEEPLPLGSKDADLRLLPHLGTHIPVKASPGPAKSIPERPEIVEPTGDSDLRVPAATAPRPSEPAPVSPQYSDTSSEDETPPRAQTPQKQQTPPRQPPLTSYEGLSLASRESGPPSTYDGINDRVKTEVGSMATQDTTWAASALETAKAPTATSTTVGVFGGTSGLPDADSGDSSSNEEDGGATPTQDESADFSMRIPVTSTPSVPLAPTGFAFGSIARTLPLVTSQNVYSPGNFGNFLGGNTLPTGQPPASNFQLPMRMPPPPFGLMNLPSSTNAGGMPTAPWQQQQQQQPNPQGLPAQTAFLSGLEFKRTVNDSVWVPLVSPL